MKTPTIHRLLPLLAAATCSFVLHAQEVPAEPAEPTESDPIVAEDNTVEDLPDQPGVAGDAVPVVGDATPRTVDMLVAYTPAARTYAGSTGAMKAAINTYITLANTCYKNSNVALSLRLVGTTEVSYTEDTGSMSTDLSRVTGTSDGYMDGIHTLRNTYGADLVSLVRRGAAGGAAGVAYLGSGVSSFASYGFSVIADDYAASNITFPHEVGHNFGCNHDRDNAGGSSAAGFGYGYRYTGTDNVQYRTVMAYAPGTRVPYFSNPSVSYKGRATGISSSLANSADNALKLETNAAVTEAFRTTVTTYGSNVRGDFNRDGKVDILVSNTGTGARQFWTMNGVQRTGITSLTTVPAVWRLCCTGDFNGDGYSDLVWEQTSTGDRCIWYMRNATMTSSVNLTNVTPVWRICGAGDFNGDGKCDLVWENSTSGARCIWYMDGGTMLSSANLTTVAPAWHIAAVGDFNADNKPDLVWENTSTGARCIWLMNNAVMSSSVNLSTVSTLWRIAGAADFNGDSKSDLIWEQTANGDRAVWYMNGTAFTSSVALPNTPIAWTIGNH